MKNRKKNKDTFIPRTMRQSSTRENEKPTANHVANNNTAKSNPQRNRWADGPTKHKAERKRKLSSIWDTSRKRGKPPQSAASLNPSRANSYRPVNLLSNMGKLYERILLKRIKKRILTTTTSSPMSNLGSGRDMIPSLKG